MPSVNRLYALLLICLLAANLAWAQEAHPIDIPAQDLRGALTALSEQTGLNTLYVSEDLAGKQAPAVHGQLTAQEALARLLDNSGLRFVVVNTDTVRIEAIPKAARPAGATRLAPVTVSASAGGGYAVYEASSATKTDTPLIQTPMAIQVVPEAVIDERQFARVTDAAASVSGVIPQMQIGLGGGFLIRGFRQGQVYVNGLTGIDGGEYDTALVDRVEIIKGPASALYGRVSPGGFVNQEAIALLVPQRGTATRLLWPASHCGR